MKYIRNYSNFSKQKRIVEAMVVRKPAEVEDVEEVVDMSYSWSDGSVEDKIEFVEKTIDEVDGITAGEIFGGIGIGVGAILGAVGIKKAYDYITSGNKGKDDGKFRVLFGSTSASPCFTTVMVKFGLPVATLGNWRTWVGTVGDLLDAIDTKDQTKIFANFKPLFAKTGNQLTVPKGSRDNMGFDPTTKQQVNLPDFLAVNGVILKNRMVFNLLDRSQEIIACGNGLLALSRLVRSAWHINYDEKAGTGDFAAYEEGVIYHTGIIEEMGDVKDPTSRTFSKLVFGFKTPHIQSVLQSVDESLIAYGWDKDEYFKRILAKDDFKKDQQGAWMRVSGTGEDKKKYYFTNNGQTTGYPLKDEQLYQAVIQHTSFGIKYGGDMTIFRDAENAKKSLKASYLQLMVQIVPTGLYGNDPMKFPAAWESISEKLGLESLTDAEIDGFLKDIENGFTKSSRLPGTLDPPSREVYNKINQKIIDKFQTNFDKISDYLLDEETTLDAKQRLKNGISHMNPAKAASEKFSSLENVGDPQPGSTTPRGKTDIKVTKQELGEGG